jgi:hypothetical protein
MVPFFPSAARSHRHVSSIEMQIRIFDNSTEHSSTDLAYELSVDIKRMVWLPNTDITSISPLPLNAVFFVIEDGGIMIDEKLYVLLRSNGLLSVGSKQNRIDTNDDIDNDSQVEEQAVSRVSSSPDLIFFLCHREFENHFKILLITSN